MGVYILAKRVVLELSSSTNFVYSLKASLPGRLKRKEMAYEKTYRKERAGICETLGKEKL